MQPITDEQMQQMLTQTKEYTLVLLKLNHDYKNENYQSIIWEHGRRNFALREEGVVSIVAPVTEEHSVAGIYIFNTDVARTTAIMKEYPAVLEGIFTYDVLPIRSFPGDSLPA